MVIYETISGHIPFHKDADLTVFMKVVEGKHPPRGVKFTAGLWGMLERCWASGPNDRPSIEDVFQCLVTTSNLSEPPSPRADEGIDEDGDWDSATSSSGRDSPGFFVTNDSAQLPPAMSLPPSPEEDNYYSPNAPQDTPVSSGNVREANERSMAAQPDEETMKLQKGKS